MTKAQYIVYQKTQKQEHIASVQVKSQIAKSKNIIDNKVTSLRLKGKELTLPLNYVTRFIEGDQSEDSKEYLLSKVSKDCLQ
jgi:hypothetical protein